MPCDHLIHNALLLTLEAGTPPLPQGYVAIRADRIAAMGQSRSPADLPPARHTLDAGGGLIMPGLVNTHCHAAMTLFRGLADDLPLQTWLQEYIFPAEAHCLDDTFVFAGTSLAAAEMLRSGITCVADGYFFAAAARQAFAQAGLRAVVGQGVVDFPAPGVPDPTTNLQVAQDFIDSGTDFPDITSTLFCHAPYTCSAATLQGAKAITRARGRPFFIHLAETQAEVEQQLAQTGMTPVTYLENLGILDEATVAVHCVWVTPTDQEILARRGVKIVHCPESNLKLAEGIAPVPDLLARGLTLSLGTDGAASNNNLDMFGEMSLAARLHKVARQDPTVLPARTVVELATRDGARVLGLGDALGTLQVGKLADLIVIDLHQPHLTPLYDPFSHLVYAARAGDVRHVMVGGRWLVRDRHLLTIDWTALKTQVQTLKAKVTQTNLFSPQELLDN